MQIKLVIDGWEVSANFAPEENGFFLCNIGNTSNTLSWSGKLYCLQKDGKILSGEIGKNPREIDDTFKRVLRELIA